MRMRKRRTRYSGVRMKRWLPKRSSLLLFGTMLAFVGPASGIYIAHYRMLLYDVLTSVHRDPKIFVSCLWNSTPDIVSCNVSLYNAGQRFFREYSMACPPACSRERKKSYRGLRRKPLVYALDCNPYVDDPVGDGSA